MKILKIEENKALFITKDEGKWSNIELLNKEDLLRLSYLIINIENIEMDNYDAELIGSIASQIIYKNVFEKLNELKVNKQKILDDVQSTYKDKFDKYNN